MELWHKRNRILLYQILLGLDVALNIYIMRFLHVNFIIILTIVLLASCTQPMDTRTNADIKDSVYSRQLAKFEITKLSDRVSEVLRFQKLKNLKVVEKIVRSSPDFKIVTSGLNKAIKLNGGKGWELDFNEDEPDTTAYLYTYYFSIYEIYDNRSPRVETYCFNLKKNQLYRQQFLDMVSLPAGSLLTVAFNRNLLKLISTTNKIN